MTSEHGFRQIIGRHIKSGKEKNAEIERLRAALQGTLQKLSNDYCQLAHTTGRDGWTDLGAYEIYMRGVSALREGG